MSDERELPPGWCWARVGELASIHGGLTKNSSQRASSSTEVPLVSVAAVRERFINLDQVGKISLTESDGEKGILKPNDLLIVEGNGSLDHIGRVALWEGQIQGARHQNHIICVRPYGVLPRFLLEWLISSKGREQIVSAATSASGLYTLSLSKIANLGCVVPPLPEQRRIVAKLDALLARSRKARAALEAIPPLLERLRQSILAAAFRGDLTADWRAKNPGAEPASELLKRIRAERRKRWEEAELAKMQAKGKLPLGDSWKDRYQEPEAPSTEGLPELPEGWCWASVEEIAEVGTGTTPNRKELSYYENGTIPWVTSGALGAGLVTSSETLVTQKALEETSLKKYPPGTILLAMYGEGKTRGTVAELGFESTTNQAIAAIQTSSLGIHIRSFIKHALAAQYDSLRETSSGGVQPNLNLEKVRQITIPLAPEQEQVELSKIIAHSMVRFSSQSTCVAALSAKYTSLEQSLLAKAFRGELVEQDAADEPAEAMLARVRGAQGAEEPKAKGKRGRKKDEGQKKLGF